MPSRKVSTVRKYWLGENHVVYVLSLVTSPSALTLSDLEGPFPQGFRHRRKPRVAPDLILPYALFRAVSIRHRKMRKTGKTMNFGGVLRVPEGQ